MTVKNTETEIKLSASATGLAGKLRIAYTEQVKEPKSENTLKFDSKELDAFLQDYTTKKLSDGAEHSVAAIDLEKVAHFREDFSQAQRLLTIEEGFNFFDEDEKADRFLIRTELTPNLNFHNTLYRPTEDNAEAAEFSSWTDHGKVSDDSKAILKHLSSLRKSFLTDK